MPTKRRGTERDCTVCRKKRDERKRDVSTWDPCVVSISSHLLANLHLLLAQQEYLFVSCILCSSFSWGWHEERVGQTLWGWEKLRNHLFPWSTSALPLNWRSVVPDGVLGRDTLEPNCGEKYTELRSWLGYNLHVLVRKRGFAHNRSDSDGTAWAHSTSSLLRNNDLSD